MIYLVGAVTGVLAFVIHEFLWDSWLPPYLLGVANVLLAYWWREGK